MVVGCGDVERMVVVSLDVIIEANVDCDDVGKILFFP